MQSNPRDLFINYFTKQPIGEINLGSTCLINNSGSNLAEHRGTEIDSYDTIIRMNDAPTANYTSYVGSHTSIRIVAHNAVRNLLKPGILRGVSRIFVWGTAQHYKAVDRYLRLIHKRFPDIEVYVYTPLAMALNDAEFELRTSNNRLGSGAWLSTGWFALFFLINMVAPDSRIVYGFRYIPQAPYHYYDKINGSQGKYFAKNQGSPKGHRFFTEYKIFELWQKDYGITFK